MKGKETNQEQEEKVVNIKPRYEKKPTNNNITTIVLLVLIIVGLVTYIAYNQGFILKKKTETKEKKVEVTEEVNKEEQENVEYLEVTDPIVTSLYYNLTTSNSTYCGKGRVSEFFTDKKVTVNDINDELAADIMLHYLFNSGVSPEAKTTFTKKEALEAIKKIFGKSYSFETKKINGCQVVNYDNKKEIYTITKSNCTGRCPTDYNRTRIVKALKNASSIEIYVRTIFVGDEDKTKETKHSEAYYNYYKDYNKKKLIEVERDYDNSVIENEITFSKGSLYKIVFTKENSNYVFTSSEPVNE